MQLARDICRLVGISPPSDIQISACETRASVQTGTLDSFGGAGGGGGGDLNDNAHMAYLFLVREYLLEKIPTPPYNFTGDGAIPRGGNCLKKVW